MKFAFGPKILMEPQFGLTFQEIKSKFQGTCKISKDATLILAGSGAAFENLELGPATLICEMGTKAPAPPVTFQPVESTDAEIYQIRGYKPSNAK